MNETEVNPIRIIFEARAYKDSFTISSGEMDYDVSHPALSAVVKN